MKGIRVISVVLVIASLFLILSSCNSDTEFKKTGTTTTTAPTTTSKTTINSTIGKFEVFQAKMGMTIEDVQKSLGQVTEIKTTDSGVVYFIYVFDSLPFVKKGVSSIVYYIFDSSVHLCEMQYTSLNSNGFVKSEAIQSFDSKYGKHASYTSTSDKESYIWLKDDVYIVITTFTNGENAISYFQKDMFEEKYSDYVKAYKESKG